MTRTLTVALLLLLNMTHATADSARTVCVFSLTGVHGEPFDTLRDFALASQQLGVPLNLRPVTNERVAAEEFQAGQCDAALLTGMRARQFNPFTGSVDAIGGLQDYDSLEMLFTALARPALAPHMRHGPYEIAGLLPLGAAYIFLNDRSINNVGKMAGKRLAVLEHDPAQQMMALRIGAQPVSADISNFANRFNNGAVDVIAAPAAAYMPLEIYRGVGAHGAVVDLPVAQLSLQLVLRHERFPPVYAQQAREYFLDQFSRAMRLVENAESEILFFFPPPDADRGAYDQLLDEARLALTKAGHYDPLMMRLMKRVRCTRQPDRAECTDDRE
ncbi:putative solute-binding protein [Isoalcanivorax indicus]|uniref:putative solute-binding protein n=1 Tax=Isoalcanivorax indicus TaxID=2202653 RepID=UPI000DB9BAC3|nr:putative solute-binding protein [Isoalcanivorax indicus]